MIRESTLDKWKPIIDGYDKKQCSLKDYCSMNNISQKSYTREYIQNQLQEDKLADQMSMKEFIDPFTGVPVKEGKGKDPFKG